MRRSGDAAPGQLPATYKSETERRASSRSRTRFCVLRLGRLRRQFQNDKQVKTVDKRSALMAYRFVAVHVAVVPLPRTVPAGRSLPYAS